jgi:hypothetical protein
MPVCIYAGLNDFLKIFPLNRESVRFIGIMGKDQHRVLPDEKYMLFRRCLYASGCEDINLRECLEAAEVIILRAGCALYLGERRG